MNQANLWHIIVAAGTGSRFGGDLPKQYCLLRGRPLLMTTIERLRRATPEAHILLVVSAGMHAFWQELCAQYGFESPAVVHGGATRFESVSRGIAAVPEDAEVISVHDGARPLIDADTVARTLSALEESGADGVIPAVAVSDSLRRQGADGSSAIVDRTGIVAVQTPQIFRAASLRRAYALPFSPQFTDDASVMEAAGGRIALAEGNTYNIKVTRPADLRLAETLLSL